MDKREGKSQLELQGVELRAERFGKVGPIAVLAAAWTILNRLGVGVDRGEVGI